MRAVPAAAGVAPMMGFHDDTGTVAAGLSPVAPAPDTTVAPKVIAEVMGDEEGTAADTGTFDAAPPPKRLLTGAPNNPGPNLNGVTPNTKLPLDGEVPGKNILR